MRILVLTEDKKAMVKIKEIGVLNTNLFGYEEIFKSVFSEWAIRVVNDFCFFEIEVKNHSNLFESNLMAQRIEVIFDNDWPVEDSYNEGEIGYCHYCSFPANQTIRYKRSKEGKLMAFWKAENPYEYNRELGKTSKLMFEAKYCLRQINITRQVILPIRS